MSSRLSCSRTCSCRGSKGRSIKTRAFISLQSPQVSQSSKAAFLDDGFMASDSIVSFQADGQVRLGA